MNIEELRIWAMRQRPHLEVYVDVDIAGEGTALTTGRADDPNIAAAVREDRGVALLRTQEPLNGPA